MADSHSTSTPEAAKASPTPQPPIQDVQRTNESEIEQASIAGQRAISAIGGGSPATPPEQFSGALGQMSGRSQVGMLRQLQRSYGNQYVGSVIQRKADGNGTCAECEKKEKEIQRKGEGDISAVPDGFEAAMQRSGGGQPLDEGTRSFMESRFEQDFGDVRVHTDSAAAEAAQQIQAKAFTTGRDIYFGRGRYQPQATEGKKLLAHELTHAVQQNGSSSIQSMAKPVLGSFRNIFEQEANTVANQVASGQSGVVTVQTSISSSIQCQPLSDEEIQRLDEKALLKRLTQNEQESQILVYSPEYHLQLEHENLLLKAALAKNASSIVSITFEELTLSNNPTNIENTLETIYRQGGPEALEEFRKKLSSTFTNIQKFAEVANTLSPQQKSSSQAWSLVNNILNLAISRTDERLKSLSPKQKGLSRSGSPRLGSCELQGGTMKWWMSPRPGLAYVRIEFVPNTSMAATSQTISFIQTVSSKSFKSRIPLKDYHAERTTVDASKDTDPFFGAEWDSNTGRWRDEPKATQSRRADMQGNGEPREGSRPFTSSTGSAVLNDTPMLEIADYVKVIKQFETVVVMVETGAILGRLSWSIQWAKDFWGDENITSVESVECAEGTSEDFQVIVEKFYSSDGNFVLDGFTAGSAELPDTHILKLAPIVDWLRKQPNRRVIVGGAATQDEANPSVLSRLRADKVRAYLVSKGVNEIRIEVESYGADWARVPVTNSGAANANRRVQIAIR